VSLLNYEHFLEIYKNGPEATHKVLSTFEGSNAKLKKKLIEKEARIKELENTFLKCSEVNGGELHEHSSSRNLSGKIYISSQWLEQALKLPGKTIIVALKIWQESANALGMEEIPLTKNFLNQINASKPTIDEALKNLEAAGLIEFSSCRMYVRIAN